MHAKRVANFITLCLTIMHQNTMLATQNAHNVKYTERGNEGKGKGMDVSISTVRLLSSVGSFAVPPLL